MMPKWSDWNVEYTKKGKARILRTRALRLLAVALAVVGAYRARQNGVRLTDMREVIGQVLQGSLARLLQASTMLREQAAAVLGK
jgi:hypothetical protein